MPGRRGLAPTLGRHARPVTCPAPFPSPRVHGNRPESCHPFSPALSRPPPSTAKPKGDRYLDPAVSTRRQRGRRVGSKKGLDAVFLPCKACQPPPLRLVVSGLSSGSLSWTHPSVRLHPRYKGSPTPSAVLYALSLHGSPEHRSPDFRRSVSRLGIKT